MDDKVKGEIAGAAPSITNVSIKESNNNNNNNKGLVIEFNGKARLGCIVKKAFFTKKVRVYIVFYVCIVTSTIMKCEKGKKNREKIADKGDVVWIIYSRALDPSSLFPDDEVLFVVKSPVAARNDILWRKKASEILHKCGEPQARVMSFFIEDLGEPKVDSRRKGELAEYFFLPLGRTKKGHPTGVWVSRDYYNRVIYPVARTLPGDDVALPELPSELLSGCAQANVVGGPSDGV